MKRSTALASLLGLAVVVTLATVVQAVPRTTEVADDFGTSPTEPRERSDQYSCNDEAYCAAVARMDCTLNGGRDNVGHVYWEPGVCMWVCNDGHGHVQVCQSF